MPLKLPGWVANLARRVRALRGPSLEETGFARLRAEGVAIGPLSTVDAALAGLSAGALAVEVRNPSTGVFESTGLVVKDPARLRALLVGAAQGTPPDGPQQFFHVADLHTLATGDAHVRLARIIDRCFTEAPASAPVRQR